MMMKIEEQGEDEKTSNIIFSNKIDIEPCIYDGQVVGFKKHHALSVPR